MFDYLDDASAIILEDEAEAYGEGTIEYSHPSELDEEGRSELESSLDYEAYF